MIDTIILNSEEEFEEWRETCRRTWYRQFEPDINHFPCKVYYCLCESNGYPTIIYSNELIEQDNEKELSEVEYLKSEIARLKSGRFTEEEFQNLCHTFDENDKCRFKQGCIDYQNKLFGVPPSQNPVIWGKGWYAIYDKYEDVWWVAPIDFFDKNEHCPDGWEWDRPDEMDDDDEFDEFVEVNGCEPNPPQGFSFCMEMCIQCNDPDLSYEEQEAAFISAGYIIKEYTF